MKKVIRLTVLMALMMVLVGTMLHAQTRGGLAGSIKKNGVGIVNLQLEVLLWNNLNDIETIAGYTTTQAGGEFFVWLNPIQWPDTVFKQIAVRFTLPVCSHKNTTYTTPRLPYSNTSVDRIDFSVPTGVVYPGCVICEQGIIKPRGILEP